MKSKGHKLKTKQVIKKGRKLKGVLSHRLYLLCLITFLFYPLIFLTGCATLEEQDILLSDATYGQFTLFLNGPDKSTLDISFDLLTIKVMSEDGLYKELTNQPITINSLSITGRQLLLSERMLPEGKYKKIHLTLKDASIKSKGKKVTLALAQEEIMIPVNITISRNTNTTLFLEWNVDASIFDKYLFNPIFTIRLPTPELSTLLVFVTNENSNNVSVINRQSNKVVSTIMVGKRPRGIASGTRKDNLKLYVANSGSNSISVIDPTIGKVSNEIPIRFGREPVDIAVVHAGAGKELLFVANYGSNTISIVDGSTFQEMEKVNVGNGPIALAVDPPLENFLSSSLFSLRDIETLRSYYEKFFNVYVANKNSKDVSILRIDKATNKCVEVVTVSVDWNPVAIAVDPRRMKVYVANYGSDKLSIIDLFQIIQRDRKITVNFLSGVGNYGVDVIADSTLDRIYFLKESPGQVLILKALEAKEVSQIGLPQILGVINTGIEPKSFAMDTEARKLYIVNRGANTVSVIDKTTRKEEQVIPVGKKPYDIEIFPF